MAMKKTPMRAEAIRAKIVELLTVKRMTGTELIEAVNATTRVSNYLTELKKAGVIQCFSRKNGVPLYELTGTQLPQIIEKQWSNAIFEFTGIGICRNTNLN